VVTSLFAPFMANRYENIVAMNGFTRRMSNCSSRMPLIVEKTCQDLPTLCVTRRCNKKQQWARSGLFQLWWLYTISCHRTLSGRCFCARWWGSHNNCDLSDHLTTDWFYTEFFEWGWGGSDGKKSAKKKWIEALSWLLIRENANRLLLKK
jgi:hypothetical protein